MNRRAAHFLAGLAVLLGAAGVVVAQRGAAIGFGGGNNYGRAGGPRIGGLDLHGQLAQFLGGGGFGGRRGGGRFGGFGGGGALGGEFMQGNESMRPLPPDREGVPKWDVDPHFKSDVFTFVRLRFTTAGRGMRGYGRGMGAPMSWLNDWPNADLNLSFRLQQLTSWKVNPDPIQLQIYDPKLFDYPFAFMLNVGALEFSDEEVRDLRRWLLNGGFLMVDDHWGLQDQRNWYEQIKRVFPDREPVELPLSHPIFHCVFDLKKLPQVPTLQTWERGGGGGRMTIRNADDPNPHYRAILDDKGRIMVMEDANTDTSDGWEREGDNKDYFELYSVKEAYPVFINILFYAMTH